jgi:hypothetical protein
MERLLVLARRLAEDGRLRRVSALVVPVLIAMSASGRVFAQETSSDWAWKDVVSRDSVSIQYIFYPRADGGGDGVVLKLVNRGVRDARYSFTLIFRSGDDHVSETDVRGTVPARSLVTGEDAGLFFEPFSRGVSVGMIGVRRLRIDRELDLSGR